MNIASAHPAIPGPVPENGTVLGVVPARLASARLPRKPLHHIAGRPLLEWVWKRAVAMRAFSRVVIAADGEALAAAARGFGAEVVVTDPAHPSGTDRVAEVARRPEFAGYPLIVNVQGDEPFLSPDHVDAAVRLVRDDGWPVATVATRVGSLDDLRSPAVVKVVRGDDGGALLFSRAPVPHPRDGDPDGESLARGPWLRHVGLYAYRREALLHWVSLPEAELERTERLEQLRPLAAGIRIGVAVGAPAEGGVDTPEDAHRAARILSRHPDALEPAPEKAPA